MRPKLLFAALIAAALAASQAPMTAFAQLSFTTQAGWRILNVPYQHQIHGLDCEAAALQMALEYEGIYVSQDSILNVMGIDWRPPYWDSAGNMHWGDPYDNFVGNPDGAEVLLTGYGTYYPTVVRAAQHFGGSVLQSGEGIPASTLYRALMNGNPVVAWGSFDWKFHQVSHYVAFDGDYVQFGSPYEHTVTLVGVTSDFVLVNNPWFGVQWIAKSTFEASYATFNRMAVIMGGRGASPGPSTSTTYNAVTPVPSDSYRPLPPTRILDTRNGTGGITAPIGPASSREVQVTGVGGVPAIGVSSVAINVTVTNTSADSYLTVYPTGSPLPPTSNLNWIARQTVPNLVVVPVGAGGKITLYNGFGSSDAVIDVEGWYGPSSTETRDGLYNALTPSRLLDTRFGTGTGGRVAPLGQDQTLTLQVTGRGGVPASGVSAVVLNVTATDPSSNSYLTVFPAGGGVPVASNLNFVAGETVPNRVVVPVGSNGAVNIFNGFGQVNVVADVGGWFTDATTAVGGSRFLALAPQRVLDTRSGFGAFPPGGTATTTLADPASMGITAVVMNATVTNTTAWSYLIAWPDNAGRPLSSDLNYADHRTVPNLVVVKLGSDGGINLYNASGFANVILDLVGYYGPVAIPG
jgi:uncharacterized protein YvpB